MRTWRPLATILVALTLVGCSGGGSERVGEPPPPTATTAAPVTTVASLVESVSSERITASLEAVVGTRVTAEERARTRSFIRAELEAAGVGVREQPFGSGGVNVIGRIEGRQPGAPVVVSAHYDTVAGSPGADDNGSGIAAVLEVARVLGRRQPSTPVELVFFDHEELGLLGSRHRAASSPAPAAVVNLDMVGFSCSVPGCQFMFPDVPDCMDVEGARDVGVGIAAVANETSLALLDEFVAAAARYVPSLEVGTARLRRNGECLRDTRRSDHAPYWDAGIPALFLTDTANFRNPNYHLPSDQLSTLDVSLIVDVTRATVATVAARTGFAR